MGQRDGEQGWGKQTVNPRFPGSLPQAYTKGSSTVVRNQRPSCLEKPSSTGLGGCLASRIKMTVVFHSIKPKRDVFVAPENILRIQTPLCLSKK